MTKTPGIHPSTQIVPQQEPFLQPNSDFGLSIWTKNPTRSVPCPTSSISSQLLGQLPEPQTPQVGTGWSLWQALAAAPPPLCPPAPHRCYRLTRLIYLTEASQTVTQELPPWYLLCWIYLRVGLPEPLLSGFSNETSR